MIFGPPARYKPRVSAPPSGTTLDRTRRSPEPEPDRRCLEVCVRGPVPEDSAQTPQTMDRLFAKGYIFDRQNKSKSVLMTEVGAARSKELSLNPCKHHRLALAPKAGYGAGG